MTAVLRTRGLTVRFATRGGLVTAVDGLDLDVEAGETLALVGESGCGKTAAAHALLGLHARPAAEVSGSISIDGSETAGLAAAGWRQIRGSKIAMVFQEPMTALNPVISVGEQLIEAIRANRTTGRASAERAALDLLDAVALPDPRRRLHDYPHQLSGGQRQRALIAIAIAGNPRVLVADEPTTALDVTIQAQILELLKRLRSERGMALVLITHDLGIVADMTDRVAMLYAGRKVEEGSVGRIFGAPLHPYTRSLLATRARPPKASGPRVPLAEIAGTVPSLDALPTGCAFGPRCPVAVAVCESVRPQQCEPERRHLVACHLAERPGAAE